MIASFAKERQRVAELLLGDVQVQSLRSKNERSEAAALMSGFETAGELHKFILLVVVAAVAAILAAIITTPLVGLIVFALSAAVLALLRHQALVRRIESFEKDYPAFLLSLASSIRTGLDPLAALLGLQALFSKRSRIGEELGLLAKAVERGEREDAALYGFARSVPHPDLALFRSAFVLSRQHGSSLGECLERLARVTRARQSFRRKARAAVAMQRLSAFGIAGCAVLIGLMQFVANAEAMRTAYHHPMGSKLLALGAFLVVGGLVWMLAMCRQKV